MQLWHRLINSPISMFISSGAIFGITLLQLLGYEFLGVAFGLRFLGENFVLRPAMRAIPVKARRERVRRGY